MSTRIETLARLIRAIVEEPNVYRIPKIQRGFVWKWERVKDFFESLYKGYPVGILVFWKTKEYIPSDPIFGSDNSEEDRKHDYYYILDGNQRVTSILLAIHGWKIRRGAWIIDLSQEDPIHADIFYDPFEDTFTFGKKGISIVYILRSRLFGDPIAQSEISKFDPEIQQKIYKVADNILGHDIPIYEIEKSIKDYKELCEIFNRINFGGVKIRQLDMVLSFFASEFSEFKDRIIELCEKYDVDLRAVIRFVFSRFGIKQGQLTREGAMNITEKIRKEFSNDAIDYILRLCDDSLNIIFEFLGRIGVQNVKLIPSQISLIPILCWIYYKIERGVNDPVQLLMNNMSNILRWWIPVILRQHYTNPDVKLQRDLDILNKYKDSTIFPADELLKNTLKRKKAEKQLTIGEIEILEDFSARKKAFRLIVAILLNRKGARDFDTKEPVSELIKRDEVTIHHIFSRSALAKANVSFEDADVQHFANITFLHPRTNNRIKDQPPSQYLYDLSEKELKAHYIPLDEDLWRCNNFDEFLKERRKLMLDELRNLGILK